MPVQYYKTNFTPQQFQQSSQTFNDTHPLYTTYLTAPPTNFTPQQALQTFDATPQLYTTLPTPVKMEPTPQPLQTPIGAFARARHKNHNDSQANFIHFHNQLELTRQLQEAVLIGNVAQVQDLIAKGADIHAKGTYNISAFELNQQIFHSENTANNHIYINKILIEQQKTLICNNFKEAFFTNNIEKIKEAIAQGADVNTIIDTQGNTALHHAALNGNSEMIDSLISEGADIFIENNNKEIPEQIGKSEEISNYLNEIKNFTLYYASENNDVTSFMRAYAYGADLQVTCENKTIPEVASEEIKFIFNSLIKQQERSFNIQHQEETSQSEVSSRYGSSFSVQTYAVETNPQKTEGKTQTDHEITFRRELASLNDINNSLAEISHEQKELIDQLKKDINNNNNTKFQNLVEKYCRHNDRIANNNTREKLTYFDLATRPKDTTRAR
jgi:hypothetical protein